MKLDADARVKDSLSRLSLAINDLLKQTQQLATNESELSRRADAAIEQAREAEQRVTEFAARMDEAERRLTQEVKNAEQRAAKYERRISETEDKAAADQDALLRRLREMEQRAALYERRADSLAIKADRTDELEKACEKLIAALDRMPGSMDEASLMQMTTKPEIPLYGTYEWQSVIDAKFGLQTVIQKGE